MVWSGALTALEDDDGDELSGTPVGSMEEAAELTGLVSIPVAWVDFSAVPTRVTSSANRPRRATLTRREEMRQAAMSAHQSAYDGWHGLGYLLGHSREHPVLTPVGVNDIGQIRPERGFEAATRRRRRG